MRVIGLKVAGELRGFPILWMAAIDEDIQVEGREYKDQEKLKMLNRRFMPEQGRCSA